MNNDNRRAKEQLKQQFTNINHIKSFLDSTKKIAKHSPQLLEEADGLGTCPKRSNESDYQNLLPHPFRSGLKQ